MGMVGAFLGVKLGLLTIMLGSLLGVLIGLGYIKMTGKDYRYPASLWILSRNGSHRRGPMGAATGLLVSWDHRQDLNPHLTHLRLVSCR